MVDFARYSGFSDEDDDYQGTKNGDESMKISWDEIRHITLETMEKIIQADEGNKEEVVPTNLKRMKDVVIYLITGNFYGFCIFVYGLWVVVGVIFYTYMDNWTNATAFYYAMEAGLNIGFCKPSESSDNSKVFTIIYVVSGTIIVAGIAGIQIT